MRNIVQNVPKTLKYVQSRERPNTIFSLVTVIVISRHLCKISRECFKFLKTLNNIPKIASKILHNSPAEGYVHVTLILKNVCTKFHKIRSGTALKNRGACPKLSPKISQIGSQQRERFYGKAS